MKLHSNIPAFLALIRPRQWVKNVLIFAPAVFAGTVFSPQTFGAALLTFLAFCAGASAVYIFNDLKDIEEDQAHPQKQHRPLAKGLLREYDALIALGVSFGVSVALSFLVQGLLAIIVLYLVLNILYTLFLKRIAVVDVAFVSSFYVLRVVAGGVATGTALSSWIILATFFLALFLVVGKRRGEFEQSQKRTSLHGYAKETLDTLLIGAGILAVCAYSLWAVLIHSSSLAVYSVILVTAVIFRVMNHLYQHPEEGETPEYMVFSDRWIFGATVLWGFLMFILLYV